MEQQDVDNRDLGWEAGLVNELQFQTEHTARVSSVHARATVKGCT